MQYIVLYRDSDGHWHRTLNSLSRSAAITFASDTMGLGQRTIIAPREVFDRIGVPSRGSDAPEYEGEVEGL